MSIKQYKVLHKNMNILLNLATRSSSVIPSSPTETFFVSSTENILLCLDNQDKKIDILISDFDKKVNDAIEVSLKKFLMLPTIIRRTIPI